MQAKIEIETRIAWAVVAIIGGLALAALLTTGVSAGASDWYVSPAGTDAPGCGVALLSPCRTVQYAISLAHAGDVINIAAGTYSETVDLDKRVTLRGAGSGAAGTVLQNTAAFTTVSGMTYPCYKPVLILGASGFADDPILIQNLRIRPRQDVLGGGCQLPGILPRPGMTVSHVTLDNVVVTGTLQSGTPEQGLTVDGGASLTYLTIQNCAFDNMAYGIIAYQNSVTPTLFSHVTVSDTTFDHNSIKGIYAEKLSAAVFENVTVTNNGDTALSPAWADPWNAGIDLNLKYDDYQNIEFNHLSVTGNGIGSANGIGLAVKARSDGGYASHPATLTGLVVNDGMFIGNGMGGVGVQGGQSVLLSNDIVAANRPGETTGAGMGLYIVGSEATLLHVTVAENTGSTGVGLYVAETSTVTVTNTILVSHTVGLTVANGSTATLTGVLWHGDDLPVGGAGTVISTANIYGTPAFVGGDYHIAPRSAARDVGVDAGLDVDIDGDARPLGAGCDVGADENADAITLVVSPAAITANGLTTTTVTATVESSGVPVDGVAVVFSSTLGLFPNWRPAVTVTTTQGIAVTQLRSVPASSTVTSTVRAEVSGLEAEAGVLFTANSCQADLTGWTEYTANPVFGEGVDGGPKAYYPSILYSPTAFDGHGDAAYYKMWFGTSGSRTGYTISADGVNWLTVTAPLTGVNGYHANVLYDAARFDGHGDAAYYKMWYWDVSTGINYATSDDGINWTNHAANPVITNTLGWGSAPVYDSYVIYNQDGAPAYYEAWIDNNGKIYYITSADGVNWAGDNRELLADRDEWESSTYSRVSVVKQGGVYHMWYGGSDSGGGNRGIGYAISTDGQHWVKSADNPILHRDDGLAWRDGRTYTPRVIYSATRFDGHGTPERYKMWFTAKDLAQGNYTIGHAVLHPVSLSHTSGSGQNGTPGSPLGQPFVVELRGSCGEPSAGVTVTFASGGAPDGAVGQFLEPASGVTDGAGAVQTTLSLGDLTGVYTVTASAPGVSGLPAVFTATAELGPAPDISITLYLPLICQNAAP